MNSYEHLRIDTLNGVRTITLDRPDRLNAVNVQMSKELPLAVDEASADDSVRVVIITGSGRAFCAGLDLGDPDAVRSASRAERLDPLRWVGKWILAVTQCDKPVIAAVNGAAAGAGLGLALACDIRIAHSASTFTAGYIRRGLSPDAGVSWLLPRLIGQSRAMEIILTGRDVTSQEAVEIGLVSRGLEASSFAAGVAQYAASLAEGPPIALALSKRLVLESAASPLEQHMRRELTHIKECLATNDVREAMQAFAEKRKPQFTGE